jgi:tetratricopeptide (TPR) repeat protein
VRRLALALAVAVAAAVAPLAASPAFADWEVTRSPFDARVVAQLKARLHANPHDAYSLKKLIDLYKRFRTLDALAGELAGEEAALGELERARGNFERAARHFEAAPRDVDDDVALGECLARLRKDADARVALERALGETNDARRRAAVLRRLAELDLGGDARRGYLERLIAADPADDDARARLVELAESQSRFADAIRELDVLIERATKDPEKRAQRLIARGRMHEAASHPDPALADYRRAYELVPRGHYLKRDALEKIASVYRKKDELRALAAEWERDWPAGARGFVEWDVLARVYDETGDSTHAQECFRKALEKDPHALEARRRLITLYEREGRDADVIAELRRLIQAAPGEPRFRVELAERLHRDPSGEKEALAICERIARETRDPAVHALLAELFTRWGLSARALAEREQLVRLEPDDETHLVNLGELYFERGDKKRADATWRRLLDRGKREQSMARLAEVYAEHNMNKESLELYQQASKLAPNDVAIKRGLAGALERAHREADAETVWEELYELALTQKRRADAYEIRQRLLTVLPRLGRMSAHLAAYRRKFDAARDDWTAAGYGLLAAEAGLRLGRLDESEQLLKALAHRVADRELQADAWIGLAQVARARHQVQQQIAALQKAAELAPSRARDLYAQIAQLSLELYRDADALAYANKAIALGPPDAQAQLRLAEVLERRDQIEEAIQAYRRALEIDDRLWRARFVLARLYLRRGEHAQAARLYREVIRRANDEEVVVDAARRAIDLEEYLGTLGELERELEPLAYAHPEKRVYRSLLVDVYQRHAAPLAAGVRAPQAARELARIGEHALAPLLEVLVDGDVAQQRQAVLLLVQLGNVQAAPPLLKLALPQPGSKRVPEVRDLHDPFAATWRARADARPIDLRTDAALAGAQLASAKDLPMLEKLAEQPEKHLQLAALIGLARVGRPGVDALLVKDLDAPSGDVQALACAGLATGARPPARALPLILRTASDRGRPDTARIACVLALGQLGARLGERGLPTGTRAALEAILRDGGGELERRAAWALGAIGARPSAALLVDAIFVKPESVRRAAEAALSRTADEHALLTWAPPRRGVDGFDVAAWLGAAEDAHPARSAPNWKGLEADVGRAITDALGRHHDLVLRALQDLDGDPRVLTFGPLGAPPDDAAARTLAAALLPALTQAAIHQDSAVRARAASVLSKTPGSDAALAKLASDPISYVRAAAIGARYAAREESLLRAFASADWRERRAGALAVARAGRDIHSARVDEALLGLLDDTSGFVRQAAAAAVVFNTHAREAIDALDRHRGDESPEVRAAIDTALGQLRGYRPDETHERTIDDGW